MSPRLLTLLACLSSILTSAWCAPEDAIASTATSPPRRVAIIGDSISKVQILPDSPVPCGFFTPVVCHRSFDGTMAYPALIAQQTGYAITNLALGGSELTAGHLVNGKIIPSMLAQVSLIPTDSTDVVFEGGTNDIAINAGGDLSTIHTVIAAIRARVPGARIVIVGVREFYGCPVPSPSIEACLPGRVAAWDAREAQEAIAVGGAFVDLRAPFPAGVSAYFPDSTHPAQAAVLRIAALVESALAAP